MWLQIIELFLAARASLVSSSFLSLANLLYLSAISVSRSGYKTLKRIADFVLGEKLLYTASDSSVKPLSYRLASVSFLR